MHFLVNLNWPSPRFHYLHYGEGLLHFVTWMTIVKQNEKAMFNEKADVQADSGYNRCIM